MRDSAHALLRIIDDVLDLSKIEAAGWSRGNGIFLVRTRHSVVSTFRQQTAAKG